MGPDDQRLRRATLAAAIVVVLAVVAVVVVFGIKPYPDLPALSEMPEPPVTAQIAVRSYDRDGSCVRVVDGRGAVTELGCGPSFEGGGLAWIDADVIALGGPREVPVGAPEPPGSVSAIRVSTGEQTTVPAAAVDTPEDPAVRDGVRLVVGGRDDEVWVDLASGEESTRALTLQGPQGYNLYQPMWSADGRWFTVDDSAGRTIVAPIPGTAAEDAPARIWLDDVNGEHALR